MATSKNADGTLAWLRDRNRDRVGEMLRMQGQISQAEIARATGLSRTTRSTRVAELKEVAVERTSVLGVGMGIPGPVDRAHGTAGSATILPGWIGLSIAAEMEQRLGIPVRIENDANLGALAELTWGAGRDCSNFAYIKAATGIGAGIVIDGRLLRGATGTAGEIGHTTLDEAGPLCYCGNRGCLETVASGPAIVQLVGRVDGESLALSQIIELAAEGDLRCRRAVADAGREIGVAVAGLCNLINPERVIVGGLMSQAGEVLLRPLRESIRRHAVQAAAATVDVRPAVVVERAELLGSVALALLGSHEAEVARARNSAPLAPARLLNRAD